MDIKKTKRINIKNESGSITLFTTISMVFFLIIVTALYINSSNKMQKQNKEIQKIQQQYMEDIDVVYEKALQANKKFLRDVVEVGDYVKYEVDTASTTELITKLGTDSGSTENTSTTLKQENLNWRVLDIVRDENGKNSVRLISEMPTTSTISLKGYNGYNNAVYLIDEVCNTLYNNSEYAKNVQSLKIEDIEEYMITKPVYNEEIMEEDLKERYYELFFKKGPNNYVTYWMSSCYIDEDSFNIFAINNSRVSFNTIYSSNTSSQYAFAIRPVVTLNADVLIDIEKSGDGSEIDKEYVLK